MKVAGKTALAVIAVLNQDYASETVWHWQLCWLRLCLLVGQRQRWGCYSRALSQRAVPAILPAVGTAIEIMSETICIYDRGRVSCDYDGDNHGYCVGGQTGGGLAVTRTSPCVRNR